MNILSYFVFHIAYQGPVFFSTELGIGIELEKSKFLREYTDWTFMSHFPVFDFCCWPQAGFSQLSKFTFVEGISPS
jgi:hypothetical protein